MNSIHTVFKHHRRAQPRQTVPQAVPAVLGASDRVQLERHLFGCDPAREPMLAHVLRHKLNAPELFDGAVPRDAVAGGTKVSFRVDDGPVRSGLLCHRSRRMGFGGVIPVLSLLGATLIGMRVGQRAPLLNDDGSIDSVTIVDVVHPTGRA